jgi:nonribosomal peptide synthetase DhbF
VELGEEVLRTHLASRIAQYKMPQKFVVQPDLPIGPSGKLDRAMLKSDALKAMSDGVPGGCA